MRAIIESVLVEKLKTATYDASNNADLTEEVSRIIRSRVKGELKMPRYKLGVQVFLGELKGQGLRLASKSLWDPKFDNWACHTFSNENLFCTALVFGTYFE